MSARRRLINGFKNTFEPDGDGFIYWVLRNKRGYSVSAAERERFVAAYERRAGLVALVVNGWSSLGLFCGVSAGLALVFRVDASWTFLAAVLAAVVFPRWVRYQFSAWPDDELRGRPIVSRVASKRERWRSAVMKRSWWSVGFDVALPTALLIDEVMDPARYVTSHQIGLLLTIIWCLIGYTELMMKTWLRYRYDGL